MNNVTQTCSITKVITTQPIQSEERLLKQLGILWRGSSHIWAKKKLKRLFKVSTERCSTAKWRDKKCSLRMERSMMGWHFIKMSLKRSRCNHHIKEIRSNWWIRKWNKQMMSTKRLWWWESPKKIKMKLRILISRLYSKCRIYWYNRTSICRRG
jgi:hypothetical protein